jgi:DNA-binding XRE family transcriptional regulator
MSNFVDNIEFVTVHCYKCSMPFAMTRDFNDRRLKDRADWFCPRGHAQHYIGKSEEQKLREEVERQRQMREAEEARRLRVEQERDQVARAHHKMRVRVMNGVCPCCNRTFQNLMQHMQTEHSGEFNLRTVRTAFGMSQKQVAEEIGVQHAYVSLHERGKPVPDYAARALESWVDQHAGASGVEGALK